MRAASSLALALAVALTRVAVADPKSLADQTFERGRALMAKKQYAEACAAFEQSQQLDPQLGTLFNLADCDAQLGKLVEAWKIYRELAKTDPNQDRRRLSADAAKQLDPQLPRVLVTIAAPPAAMTMQLDGNDATALVGVATPVDAGAHAIVITAPGFREWHGKADAAVARTERIVVQLEPLGAPDATEPPGTTAAHADVHAATGAARRGHRSAVPMIAGGATVAVGLAIGGFAYSAWSDAQGCTTCTGDDKRSSAHTAVILGDVSTVVVALGLVGVAAGFYLWETSSSVAVIAPQVGTDHAGVTLLGRF